MKDKFFRAELARHGNDFVVKVPEDIVESLNMEHGNIVSVTIAKAGFVEVPEQLVNVYKKHLPSLDKLTNEEVSNIINALDVAKTVDKEKMKQDLAAANPF